MAPKLTRKVILTQVRESQVANIKCYTHYIAFQNVTCTVIVNVCMGMTCALVQVNQCRPTAFVVLTPCSNHLPLTCVCVCACMWVRGRWIYAGDCKVTRTTSMISKACHEIYSDVTGYKTFMSFKSDPFTILLWWLHHSQTYLMPTNVHRFIYLGDGHHVHLSFSLVSVQLHRTWIVDLASHGSYRQASQLNT